MSICFSVIIDHSTMRRRYIATRGTEETDALYDTADGVDERQFQSTRRSLPIKSIVYILGFLIAGTVSIEKKDDFINPENKYLSVLFSHERVNIKRVH